VLFDTYCWSRKTRPNPKRMHQKKSRVKNANRQEIEIRRLTLFGHLSRMDENRLPDIAKMVHDAEEY